MVKKSLITGFKRTTTTAESRLRFFQTMERILVHLKRDQDKKMILTLIGSSASLKEYLIATAAVHLYHDMGIRVKTQLTSDSFSDLSSNILEKQQKEVLTSEFGNLLSDYLKLEINLQYKIFDLENCIISLLIKERTTKLSDNERTELLDQIDSLIENTLVEMIKKYPSFYFYDFMGDLIGLSYEVKDEIFKDASGFKEISLEVEKRLEQEEKEDHFIELTTLNKLIARFHSEYEFRSYKELQTSAMPVRMIKKGIKDHEINKFPISISGLKAFIEGNNLKKNLLTLIEEALSEKIDYNNFEDKILGYLKREVIKILKSNPNDFLYFLQCINESNFDETILFLQTKGIQDVMQIYGIDEDVVEKVKRNMIRYNINKQDLIILNDYQKNLIYQTKKILCNLKVSILSTGNSSQMVEEDWDLTSILYKESPNIDWIWKKIEQSSNFTLNDLKEFSRKKIIIDKVFFHEMNISSYSQIAFLLEFDSVMNSIIKDVYLSILSKILRQYCRIIELYDKLRNDKGIILQALSNLNKFEDEEDWIVIKIEELVIDRLIRRQKEVVDIFNASNQFFLVNGFILSILIDCSIKDGITALREKPSFIYPENKQLPLRAEFASPVSYCIAFDILKRLEGEINIHKIQHQKLKASEEKEKKQLSEDLKEKHKKNSLNWIETKLTSALIGINRPGMSPKQFYWEEKDTKTAAEYAKIHSELNDDIILRFCDFYQFAIEIIRKHCSNLKLPDLSDINNEVSEIVNQKLSERLNRHPTPSEIDEMLDGERYQISLGIASNIGKLLNKALYLKFKEKRR